MAFFFIQDFLFTFTFVSLFTWRHEIVDWVFRLCLPMRNLLRQEHSLIKCFLAWKSELWERLLVWLNSSIYLVLECVDFGFLGLRLGNDDGWSWVRNYTSLVLLQVSLKLSYTHVLYFNILLGFCLHNCWLTLRLRCLELSLSHSLRHRDSFQMVVRVFHFVLSDDLGRNNLGKR
jgi:hypothetical protein